MDPTNNNISSRWLPFNKEAIIKHTRTTAAIIILAASIFGAVALAHLNQKRWIAATVATTVLSVFAIPKLMEKGKYTLARSLLIVTLIAAGSLFVGGGLTLSYSLAAQLFQAIGSSSLANIIRFSFAGTGLLGYVVPAGIPLLKRSYTLLTDKEKLADLGALLSHISTNEKSFIKRIMNKIGLIATFCMPEDVLKLAKKLKTALPIESRAAIYTLTDQRLAESIDTTLDLMNAIYQNPHDHPKEHIDSLLISLSQKLKASIEPLEGEVLDKILLVFIEKIGQSGLPPETFVEIFKGKILNRINYLAEEFARATIDKAKYDHIRFSLEGALSELEDQQDQADLLPRLEEIKSALTSLQQKIEEAYRARHRWQQFLELQNPKYLELPHPFPLLVDRLKSAFAPETQRVFLDYYHDIMGMNLFSEGFKQVQHRIRILTAKLSGIDEKKQDSIFRYLNSHYLFNHADFAELLKWLKVDSLLQITEKLREIGLHDIEDLFAKEIAPREKQLSKANFQVNLKQYIDHQFEDKRDLRTRLYSVVGGMRNFTPSQNRLIIRISLTIYRMATMGMILVPVLIYPIPAAVGFGVGLLYYTLKRFRSQSLVTFNSLVANIGGLRQIQQTIAFLTERPFIYMSEGMLHNMRMYAQADFFGKMRILNLELFAALLIAYAQITDLGSEPFGAGGLLQGMALGREAIDLI